MLKTLVNFILDSINYSCYSYMSDYVHEWVRVEYNNTHSITPKPLNHNMVGLKSQYFQLLNKGDGIFSYCSTQTKNDLLRDYSQNMKRVNENNTPIFNHTLRLHGYYGFTHTMSQAQCNLNSIYDLTEWCIHIDNLLDTKLHNELNNLIDTYGEQGALEYYKLNLKDHYTSLWTSHIYSEIYTKLAERENNRYQHLLNLVSNYN